MGGRSEQVKLIFLEAIEQHAPEQWPSFLERACGGDAVLRADVEKLLAAQAAIGSFHEEPRTSAAATPELSLTERPGMAIGSYQLLDQIGEGGFGIVFLAEQQRPVRRMVALKVLKPGMDTRQVVARFEAERQALALMDHPNIAKVIDGGETASGRPFFVMELVKGISITDYCDQNHLTPRQRLELFVSVCQAVQHAHQKGLIHRDIKPSNVLVVPAPAPPLDLPLAKEVKQWASSPVVKVIDFGVAKALGQALTDKTVLTGLTQMIGTPLYMSPEQAGESGLDIDTRSDIYSLGVLLYELLTGTTPFDKKRFQKAAYEEIRRIIREEEPPKPSTRLTDSKETLPSISARRQTEPAKLTKLVRGELDWIVMKCLEKDRDRRYETANGLAADVQRYLADEAVEACPPSALYKFRKFARRNKRALATAALLAVMFLAALGIGAGSLGWVAHDRATRQAQAAEAIAAALDEAHRLQLEGKWSEARGKAQSAEALLTSVGGSEELWQRWRQGQADLRMLADLDEARLQQTSVKNEQFDNPAGDPIYAAAFQTYQLPVLNLEPQEAADRIILSSINKELVAALANWATITPKAASREKLRAIARLADRDPWRQQVHDALSRGDVARLVHLSREPQVLEQAPANLELLGVNVARHDLPAAVAFLRRAHFRYPADFWINQRLAMSLVDSKPPQLGQAIGYYRAALAIRPQSPGAYLNLGRALYESGAFDEAIAAAEQALRWKPDYAMAHFNLGNALHAKSLPDKAMAAFQEAIRLKPDYAEAYCSLGFVLQETGRPDEGIAACEHATKLKPGLAVAHYNLGVARRKKGRTDEAIAAYGEAIRLQRDFADAYTNLGIMYVEKDRLDEAITAFKEVIRLKPDSVQAHTNLGQALQLRGRLDEAITACQDAVRLEPNHAIARNNLGTAFWARGRPDDAIVAFKEAIRLKPDYAMAHFNLGVVFKAKGRLDEAIAAYNEAIRLRPNYAAAFVNLGAALQQQGRLDEAIATLDRAVRLKPDDAEAHCNLALALAAKGRPAEAVASFEEARRLQPRLSQAFNGLARLRATCSDLKFRDPAQAIELAEFAVALAPKNGLYWNTLGLAQYRAGAFQRAIISVEKAVDVQKGGDAFDRFLLAMAHWQIGQRDQALMDYERAVKWMEKQAPQNEELRRFRAEASELLGIKESKN